MSSHTPGPWKLHGNLCEISDPANGNTIAFIYRVESAQDADEARANARLIAAAPELLEALTRVIFDATHAIHDPSMGTALLANECRNAAALIYRITHDSAAPSAEAARAAIAKAEERA